MVEKTLGGNGGCFDVDCLPANNHTGTHDGGFQKLLKEGEEQFQTALRAELGFAAKNLKMA